jgi:ABC-type nitrate/sulfonate/bicarbonate transport system substrate-binding protein
VLENTFVPDHHIPRIVLERSGVDPEKLKYVAVGSPADRFKALIAGKVDATVVTNTEVAKLASYPEIVDLVNVPKVVPEIPYEFGMAREDYIQKNTDTLYKLAKAIIEANRWIIANKAGTLEVARKILPDESPEVLSKTYDLADPRLWGVNGDITEASYNYTVEFLKGWLPRDTHAVQTVFRPPLRRSRGEGTGQKLIDNIFSLVGGSMLEVRQLSKVFFEQNDSRKPP